MASGWNLWVWLICIGVVIIIITFPYFTCISSFLAAAPWYTHACVHTAYVPTWLMQLIATYLYSTTLRLKANYVSVLKHV